EIRAPGVASPHRSHNKGHGPSTPLNMTNDTVMKSMRTASKVLNRLCIFVSPLANAPAGTIADRWPRRCAIAHPGDHPQRAHRSHDNGDGPSTPLNVTSAAIRKNRDNRTTSMIFDRFSMFVSPIVNAIAFTIADRWPRTCAIAHHQRQGNVGNPAAMAVAADAAIG